MNKDDLILVSVDDHVVEPPDVFENHLPAKYQEYAPKLKEREDGTLAWYYYHHEITNVGLNAVAGRPREEYGIEPTRLDEMRKGCWDVDERIKDMNAGGVEVIASIFIDLRCAFEDGPPHPSDALNRLLGANGDADELVVTHHACVMAKPAAHLPPCPLMAL